MHAWVSRVLRVFYSTGVLNEKVGHQACYSCKTKPVTNIEMCMALMHATHQPTVPLAATHTAHRPVTAGAVQRHIRQGLIRKLQGYLNQFKHNPTHHNHNRLLECHTITSLEYHTITETQTHVTQGHPHVNSHRRECRLLIMSGDFHLRHCWPHAAMMEKFVRHCF